MITRCQETAAMQGVSGIYFDIATNLKNLILKIIS